MARAAGMGDALGFLTVVEHEQHGYFGGYLVLNSAGRPLEFHLTAPVKPNRAQEILYGPTLAPFLFGEHIGLTLISKAEIQPSVVLTDREPVLAARDHVETPLAWVRGPAANADQGEIHPDGEERTESSSAPAGRDSDAVGFEFAGSLLSVNKRHADDEAIIRTKLAELSASVDFLEPFGRIQGAIEEAQRGGK